MNRWQKFLSRLAYMQPLFFLLACASFQVTGEVQSGRIKLIQGDTKAALANFQQAAQLDPDYVADFTPLRESVWTYVGRAHYAQGQLSEAQKALEKARSRHQHDNMAKLYLGLVLARGPSPQKGLQEIQAGLTGLRMWLDSMAQYHPDGRFWDSNGELRSEIQKQLALLSGKEIGWPEVVSGGEWLGKKLEEEMDLVKMVARREQRGEGGND